MSWEGNAALRKLVEPIDSLHEHPRNPRRGNLPAVQASLARFGQQRPILALPDGTMVAGHHVWRAAQTMGWTEIAVVRSDLTDEEIEAYLLADNGTADQGYYDERTLAELLNDMDNLEGTGFGAEDAQAIIRAMLWMPELDPAPREKPPAGQPYAEGTAKLFHIVLAYDQATYDRVSEKLDAAMSETGAGTYGEALAARLLGG